MATFNYILGRKKKDGHRPIYLKICNGTTNTMRSLDMTVLKSEWNAKSQRISIRRTDDYDTRSEKEQNNDFLDSLMNRAREVERMLKKRGVLEELSAKRVMEAILNYSEDSKQIEGSGDFVQYWRYVMMETPKSQQKYEYALKTIVNYQIKYTGKDVISFRDITVDWVRNYLADLQHGYQYLRGGGSHKRCYNLSASTVQTYSGCLKKVLNCAVDTNRFSADVLRGFRNFKSKVVHKSPFTLTVEQLRELMHYPFKTMRQQMMRDMFIFSLCTMGMNLTDIYNLGKKDIKWNGDSGEINYIRNKTNKPIRVKLCSYAGSLQKLIAPYCSDNKRNIWLVKIDSNYYFGLDYNYLTYKTFCGNAQKVIRQIRAIMGYDEGFTFYSARDSWTTIMHSDYQLGQEYTDAGLGHSSRSLSATCYTNIDFEKLYECHADMMQRLFEK